MKVGKFELDHFVGDVYFFNVVYREAEAKQILRIGGKEEADIRADSGMGKLVIYLLEHIGEFFDLDQLSEATRIKPITLKTYLSSLDSRFLNSQFYQMLARNGSDDRVYALAERTQKVEGEPIRVHGNRGRYGVRSLAEKLKE